MMPHPPRSTRTATLVPYSTLFLSHRLDHRLDEAGDLRRGGIGNFGRALAQDRVAHTGDLEYRHASNMRSRSSPVKGPSTTGLVPPRGNALSFPGVPEAVCRGIPASPAFPGAAPAQEPAPWPRSPSSTARGTREHCTTEAPRF